MIQTNTKTFLVKFQFNGTEGSFIFQKGQELKELLKVRQDRGDTRGIESLKSYDYRTDQFKRISKIDFLKWVDYETEAIEFFKTHPYFNKVKF